VLRVGLTGGIACGKSHVLRRLRALGLPTLDLDQVSRDVVAPGSPALGEIVAAFGTDVLAADGSLERAALGRVVFADPSARARLNAIVHPRVRAAEARWAAARAAAGDTLAITDAALIVEAGAHLRFRRVVVVHCDPAQQLARLQARDRLDEEAARARVAAQMPLAEKRSFAHFEIDTSGTVDETDARAEALAADLRSLAGRPQAPPPPLAVLASAVAAGPVEGPRELGPSSFLAAAAEAHGLELAALSARLEPPSPRWLEAAGAAAPGAPAAALAPALVAWHLARGSADADYLASAAGSLARLTHDDPAERAASCLYALVLEAVATGAAPASEAARPAAALTPLAVRWGGGAPSAWLRAVWTRAAQPPGSGGGAAPVVVRLAAALRAAAAPRPDGAEVRRIEAVLARIAAG